MLMDRLDGDTKLLGELIGIFLNDLPDRIADVEEAVQARELPTLHERTHALKGSLGNLAATRAYEAARDLDELARLNEETGIDAAYARFKEALLELESAFLALYDELKH